MNREIKPYTADEIERLRALSTDWDRDVTLERWIATVDALRATPPPSAPAAPAPTAESMRLAIWRMLDEAARGAEQAYPGGFTAGAVRGCAEAVAEMDVAPAATASAPAVDAIDEHRTAWERTARDLYRCAETVMDRDAIEGIAAACDAMAVRAAGQLRRVEEGKASAPATVRGRAKMPCPACGRSVGLNPRASFARPASHLCPHGERCDGHEATRNQCCEMRPAGKVAT